MALKMREENRYLRSLGYLLGEKFNSGSFSTIYLCLRISDAEKVAVKVVDLRSTTKEYRTRFLTRELANVASLRHPNIIKVHKVGRSETKAYIIMDFANSNLHSHIEFNEYVAEEQARRWFKQLTSALEYLHRKRVAHRDIKIENILLDKEHNIKLCDFGFSKLCERNASDWSQSTTFCGSLGYCAPEILLRTPYDPHKTDIWSLGVVLYKMVVGGMPFGEGNDLGSVRKISVAQTKTIEFPNSPKTSRDCRELIRSLLTVETAHRITITDVMQSKWLNPPTSPIYRQISPNRSQSRLFSRVLGSRLTPHGTKRSIAKSAYISRWLPAISSKFAVNRQSGGRL